MKTKINYKLMRKCLILVIMIVGLTFVATNSKFTQPVSAAPCCESCTLNGDPMEVHAWCAYTCYAEPNPSVCESQCIADADSCFRHCVYCSGGGPPGGECNSNGDCNYDEFCGSDGYCHWY